MIPVQRQWGSLVCLLFGDLLLQRLVLTLGRLLVVDEVKVGDIVGKTTMLLVMV